jgi:hypothetical protein
VARLFKAFFREIDSPCRMIQYTSLPVGICLSINGNKEYKLCEVSVQIFFPACYRIPFYFPSLSPDSLLALCSFLDCSSIRKYYFQSWKTRRHQLENNESKKSFFLFLIIYSILKITDSAADPIDELSLLEFFIRRSCCCYCYCCLF